MDHDQGEISDPHRPQRFTDEIKVTRSVDNVELAPQPFGMHERGMDGNLAVLFLDMIVGDGAPAGDTTDAINNPAASEHSLAKHGFSAGCMTDDGEVTNLSGLIDFHRRAFG